MKATAIAPSNIAFIKYWGKADEALRLPLNGSLSMNLDATNTVTTVEFSPVLSRDEVTLLDGDFSDKEIERIIKSLNLIRSKTNTYSFARIATKNTFPKGAGAAASASGFAALTVAAFAALGITLSEKELTVFARMGSGSACRSIPDGFVEWKKGNDSDSSYAYSLHPSTYWDLRDVLVIVDYRMKKISTTEGQTGVKTSPFWRDRVAGIPAKMAAIKAALKAKNFRALGRIIEEDCLNMHHVMQTQNPPVYYWNDVTKTIMDSVVGWRKQGLPVYFTIDAGPNVHLVCEAKDEAAVIEKVQTVAGVENIIVNRPAQGTHLIQDHLF
ncbi:MAG: diphosphomevalonate decarboxylase [Candidatus Gottesmanbacteria bacterium]|nr:diphosphomevalonate decarboxylase [Candidatus Gottesmanbacteria bacterium]